MVFVFATPVIAQEAKPDPRETLETAVPEGIRLLRAKEYKTFVESFVAPDDLKKITEKTPLEELLKEFIEQKAPKLLESLEEIKGTKPSLDSAGTKATFAFKKEIDGKNGIIFVKVGEFWYIMN